MLAHEEAGHGSHCRDVEWLLPAPRETYEKRIRNRTVDDPVAVGLRYCAVTGVKPIGSVFDGKHRHVTGKRPVYLRQEASKIDRIGQDDACDLALGMCACVGTARAIDLNVGLLTPG